MEAKFEPSLRDQPFKSATNLLDKMDTLGPVELVELVPLKDGLISLQDTLLGSINMAAVILGPFYLLCHDICIALHEQLSSVSN